MLSEFIPIEKSELLGEYFSSLTPNTIDKITASKVSDYLDIDVDIARKILMKCKNEGLLKLSLALRCPECGSLIKRLDDYMDDFQDITSCYVCGEENLEVDEKNIELLFELIQKKKSFNSGQQITLFKKQDTTNVALENSMSSYLKSGILDINKELYSISKKEYEALQSLCEEVRASRSKKAKGDSLERLAKYMFNLCKIFRANEIRTSVNQIDCYVRNKAFFPCGVFRIIGPRIIIECKNEDRVPAGTYISKMHSIISEINGKGDFVKFGIIISKKKAPGTYKKHAVKYFLAKEIVIIHICLDEVDSLVQSKGNLLDIIEQKAEEIILDATTDLKVAGLYGD